MTPVKIHLRSWFHFLRFCLTRHNLKGNEKFCNQYMGQRCFIVCTGKSLNKFDLKLLQGEKVIGCNQLYKHPDAHLLSYVGYFDLDPVSSHTCNIDPFWSQGGYHRELASFANKTGAQVFQRLGLADFCRKNGALFKNVAYIQTSGLLSVASSVKNNLAGQMNILDGVVYAMLGSAQFMGFKEIFLLGCDYTFTPRQVGHFYDDFVLLEDIPVDQRHFKLKRFLDDHDVHVTNLVPDGFTSPLYDSLRMSEFGAEKNASYE